MCSIFVLANDDWLKREFTLFCHKFFGLGGVQLEAVLWLQSKRVCQVPVFPLLSIPKVLEYLKFAVQNVNRKGPKTVSCGAPLLFITTVPEIQIPSLMNYGSSYQIVCDQGNKGVWA